jgi:flagellin-like hook-associated protein FlgL
MRIATKTLYESGAFRINSNLSQLNSTSEIVSTGKKINSSSDDPTGYHRIQNVYTSLDQMEQIQRNITTGTSWTTNTESVLTTLNESIIDARDIALELAGSYMGEDERDAVSEQINDMLLNIQMLSSTTINGSYLFSGTETDTQPFVFDNDEWPTSVTYQGNDNPFQVDTGNAFYTDVSIPGNQVFISSEIRVDSTNNIIDFREDADTAQLTATIEEGKYSASELAEAIEDAMEQVSSAAYRITGITNSAGIGTSISVGDYSKLDMASTGTIQLDWNGNGWQLADNGGYTGAGIASDSDENQVAIDLDGDGVGDIDIALDSEMVSGGSVAFDITAGTAIDYDVTYDETTATISIAENGTTLTDLELLWDSGTGSGQSIAPDIGFTTDLTGATTYSGDPDVTWGIFETLMDLRDALDSNDSDGISRAITRLNTHYDQTSTQVARAGIKTQLMETRDNVIDSLALNLETEKSEIEDADMVKVLSDLSAKQTAYEAALSAYSKIVSVSILDYM